MIKFAFLLFTLTQATEPELPKTCNATNAAECPPASTATALALKRFKLHEELKQLENSKKRFLEMITPPSELVTTHGTYINIDFDVPFPGTRFSFQANGTVDYAKEKVNAYLTSRKSEIAFELDKIESEFATIGYKLGELADFEALLNGGRPQNPRVPLRIEAKSIADVSELIAKIQAHPKEYCNLDICIYIAGTDITHPEPSTQAPAATNELISSPQSPDLESQNFHEVPK